MAAINEDYIEEQRESSFNEGEWQVKRKRFRKDFSKQHAQRTRKSPTNVTVENNESTSGCIPDNVRMENNERLLSCSALQEEEITDVSGDVEKEQMLLALSCLKKKILLEGLIAAAALSFNIQDLFSACADREQKVTYAVHSLGDLHTVVDVVRRWCRSLRSKRPSDKNWCKQHGFNEAFLQEVESKVQYLYSKLKHHAQPSNIPALNFKANASRNDELLVESLCEVFGSRISLYKGHESLGYQNLATNEKFNVNQSSFLTFYWKMPYAVLSIPAGDFEYYTVLSDTKAQKLTQSITGKTLNEVEEKIVFKRFHLPNIGRIVRANVLDHFDRGSAAVKALHQELLSSGMENPGSSFVIQKDDSWFGLDLFCLPDDKDTVEDALNTMIYKERECLNRLQKEIPYPNNFSSCRFSIGNGMKVQHVLFDNEHLQIGVYIPEDKLRVDEVLATVASFDGVASVEKVDSSSNEGISAVLSLSEPKVAARVASMVDQQGNNIHTKPIRNIQPTAASPLVEVSCRVKICFRWLVHTDRYKKAQVRDDHLVLVKAGLCRLLQYIDENKYDMQVEKVDSDKKNVHGSITCLDHYTAYRILECLYSAKTKGVGLDIVNEDDIQCSLRKMVFKIDNRLFEVLAPVVMAKLQNCQESLNHSHFSYSLSNAHSSYHTLDITFGRNAKQCDMTYLHDKIMGALQPLEFRTRKKDVHKICSSYGQTMLYLTMVQTKTFIHIPEFTHNVHIYGTRKCALEAKELLNVYVAEQPYFEWEKVLREKAYPHDLNCILLKNKASWENGDTNKIKIVGKDVYYARTLDYDVGRCLDNRFQQNTECSDSEASKEDAYKYACDICFEVCESFAHDCFPADHVAYVLECCGHRYCWSCLDTQLKVTLTQSMLCGACNCPFSVQDLLNITGLHQGPSISNQMSKCVRMFVTSNMDAYGWCSKPDCNGVFRKAREDQEATLCCSCSREMCLLCFRQRHGKMSCEEFLLSHCSVDVWMAECPSSRKRCPKCNMGIEKNGGCNHVHCVFCQTSICWVCLQTFANSQKCYDHMEVVHGGMYN